MHFVKLIRKQIRRGRDNADVVADINAVVAANVGQPGRSTVASSSQSVAYSRGAGESSRATPVEREEQAPPARRETEQAET
jgi:hypothetical protein